MTVPNLLISPLAIVLSSSFALAQAPDDFSHRVVPILKKHCVQCHGGKEAKGGLSINTRNLFLDGGHAIPSDIAGSHFLDLIISNDPEVQMPPPSQPRLAEQEVQELRRWVAAGIPWDDDFTFAGNTYEPPLKPRLVELPAPQDGRNHPLDRILDRYLIEQKLSRPLPIDDATFYRRVSLDLIGLLPVPEELGSFLADKAPDKRRRLIDRLLAREIDYADHWLTFWNDLLRNDYTGTGFITGGRKQISGWLYDALLSNKPYDQFTRELLAPPTDESRGFIDGIRWRGEVSAGQTVEIQFSQSLSQAFLGVNMKCASCHDSFIDRWTLKEAYGLAAIYSQRELAIHRCDKPTGEVAQAAWLFPELGEIDANAPQPERLRQLATLMTHPDNGRFSRTIVNRMWAQLMGRGIVHPLDAMQTEPWNADLLDHLANVLVDQKYDLKAVLRLIANSEAYQSQTEILTQEAIDGEYIYRGPRARRMTAEQFLDNVWLLTGAAPLTIDAPVYRGIISPEEARQIQLSGSWIWRTPPRTSSKTESPVEIGDATPAAGETVLLRKIVELPTDLTLGGAALTCDNEFVLFVNNREVIRGDDWNKVQSVSLHRVLKKGTNEIVALAKNAGDKPNPAGFFFEARLALTDGSRLEIRSDASWEWNDQLPKSRSGTLGKVEGTWHPVRIVPELTAWRSATELQVQSILGRASHSQLPMVRASLLNSDFLMRSLGRPLREQIVSSRPSDLTTLEAIDLTNGATLADALATGAKQLLQEEWQGPEKFINDLFLAAFSRQPTTEEQTVLVASLDRPPSDQQIEDLLWVMLLMPEFMLIR